MRAIRETGLDQPVTVDCEDQRLAILEIGGADLDAVAGMGAAGQWVAERSRDWLRSWRAAAGLEDFHPFDLLARLRFRVTVNTDNRLMSDTTMSREMFRLVETFGYGWSDLARFTINAMKSAFIHFDERLAIIDEVIKPRYAVLVG